MACLLQPEYNFLHGYFRCKLPVEIVDMEVKVTSMQETHIFRRDQTTQQVRCVPWTPNLHLHPNMIKKMKTFLEVDNKMGPIIPALANQYRLPLPVMNPNVRKGNATEKRRTATPKRRFRPAAPKTIVMQSPLPEAPPKPTSNAVAASVTAMETQDTPWPSAGKMSGNLFQDRNWLLLKDCLAAEGKREEMSGPHPEEEDKMGEQDPKEEKCGWGPGCSLCETQKKKSQYSPSTGTNGRPTATETLTQTASDKAQHPEYDQNKTAMGTGDGEIE